MAEVEAHHIDEELDRMFKEAEEWVKKNAEERKKALAEAAELAKGKEVRVLPSLNQGIIDDQLHQRIVKLSLPEIVVYSGQGRIATHREQRELARTRFSR